MSPVRWTRDYPGRYTATALTTLEQHGVTEQVEVLIAVRFIPEWSGDRWAFEALAKHEDYTSELATTGDTACRTMREAKAGAEAAMANGWKYIGGIGWCAR